jgi:hypothetical protein
MSQFGTKSPHLRTLHLQRSLWFFVQVVAFLAPLFAFNSAASAESCGHYLFRNGVPVHLVSAPDVHNLVMPFQHQTAQIQDAGVPAPRHAPCNGPGCKNRSKPMLPGSSPVTLSVTTDPAILATHLLMCGCLDETTAIPQSEKGDVFRSPTIFRPPAC